MLLTLHGLMRQTSRSDESTPACPSISRTWLSNKSSDLPVRAVDRRSHLLGQQVQYLVGQQVQYLVGQPGLMIARTGRPRTCWTGLSKQSIQSVNEKVISMSSSKEGAAAGKVIWQKLKS
ncbi:hypothetical protein Pst134EA_015771 [Puccinia striiformis f. sp. tritici]|uniref:hypothetical protein n=1 Tax=Puccinia striiformis f. sp. tritici TaxID=168172 RepID=UPI0020088220|nr:hypothetical protein Pst134EA_015771 [Puccinia striiformis f. sp. tritici]KAH9463686.1 hypothetical protein Pst134EA_015771 [Puccinia striiformis f. sp. tritici]